MFLFSLLSFLIMNVNYRHSEHKLRNNIAKILHGSPSFHIKIVRKLRPHLSAVFSSEKWSLFYLIFVTERILHTLRVK